MSVAEDIVIVDKRISRLLDIARVRPGIRWSIPETRAKRSGITVLSPRRVSGSGFNLVTSAVRLFNLTRARHETRRPIREFNLAPSVDCFRAPLLRSQSITTITQPRQLPLLQPNHLAFSHRLPRIIHIQPVSYTHLTLPTKRIV